MRTSLIQNLFGQMRMRIELICLCENEKQMLLKFKYSLQHLSYKVRTFQTQIQILVIPKTHAEDGYKQQF